MVFTNDLDRHQYPVNSRLWGMFVGTLLMSAIAVALVSPRTIAFSLPIIAFAMLVAAYFQGLLRNFGPQTGNSTRTMMVLLAVAMASALWSAKPAAVFEPVAGAFACVIVANFMLAVLAAEPRCNIYHLAEGLWLGLLIGMFYLGLEIMSHQAIKLYLYNALGVSKSWLRPPGNFFWSGNHLDAISPMDLTRNIAPITLTMWAALLCLQNTAPGGKARIFSALLFVTASFVIMFSEHETSKVALICGSLIFVIARYSARWGDRLLKVGWVVACLAVVPMALLFHRVNLQHASWVQPTLQHRIVIWNHTAEAALKSPLIGIGAGMMYELDGSGPMTPGEDTLSGNAPHAHNVYLQTWYELGALGAAILTLIGLAILEYIRSLEPKVAPYAQATFMGTMIMAAASYGIWQPWFLAMFALAAVSFGIAIRVSETPRFADQNAPGCA